MPVPVIKKQPTGKVHSRNKYSASSSKERFILFNCTVPAKTVSLFLLMSRCMVVSDEIGSFITYKKGPSAQLLSYTFACGKYKGFSPSILRELISLPIVHACISPFELMNSVNSGSGTSQEESLRMYTSCLCAATRCESALKNNSGRSASYTF